MCKHNEVIVPEANRYILRTYFFLLIGYLRKLSLTCHCSTYIVYYICSIISYNYYYSNNDNSLSVFILKH